MHDQKIILIFLSIFLIVSFSLLAISEKKQHTIEDGWFLYFNNITDNSLDFSIENYSDETDFMWELSSDENVIKKESIQVLKGNKKNVTLSEPLKGKRIKITVYHAKEIKEIYKNFE